MRVFQKLVNKRFVAEPLKLHIQSRFIGENHLIWAILEQIKEISRVRSGDYLYRLAILTAAFRMTQSIKSILDSLQQMGV